ncbi:MAG: S-adenosylmethionine:tRNA ribosyltransferase-isomerase [Sediminibacterium sp.]
MHPKDIRIVDYNYSLPEEKIAKYPLAERHLSKLLVYEAGKMREDTYLQLHEYLPANSLLIFNNTKVVAARLLFQKATGGGIEIFCLEPDEQYPDISTAMQQKGKVWWKCLVGGAKKWKEPFLTKTISHNNTTITLQAKQISRGNEDYTIEFTWTDVNMSFAELLYHAGLIPLPPYLNRAAEISDQERYQTIYAEHEGSVAAPTAGLHFTPTIFNQLSTKNIRHQFVTLHVGAGTFKPVKTNTIAEHEMHAEFMEVSITLIDSLLAQMPETIVCVGTTSMRSIESLYWLGIKTMQQPNIAIADLTIQQWDPYQENLAAINVVTALESLKNWMQKNQLKTLLTKTQIIIAPGYSFKICQGLITNFHQPQSTLLLLVSALIGTNWKRLYQHALDNNFRFLSYGDGCLIWIYDI